jgi:hypothetical protein
MPYDHELTMADETPSTLKTSWLVGIAAAFLIFAVIASYSARMTQDYEGFDAQRAQARYETLHKLEDDAHKTLTTADWVDQDKGTVRIPIQEAMLREIDTLKSQPPAAGAAIPGAAPASSVPATNAAPAAASPPPKPGPAASQNPAPAKTSTTSGAAPAPSTK